MQYAQAIGMIRGRRMARAFLKLTRAAMRKLPPGETIIEHGITFERLAHGEGVFTVNVMVDGQRIHRVIGRESDGTTRTQAEAFIEKSRLHATQPSLTWSRPAWTCPR